LPEGERGGRRAPGGGGMGLPEGDIMGPWGLLGATGAAGPEGGVLAPWPSDPVVGLVPPGATCAEP